MKTKDRRKNRYVQIWVICPDCGKGRYVGRQNMNRVGYSGRCMPCASNHPLWESKGKLVDVDK